jgi:hypothetical protein
MSREWKDETSYSRDEEDQTPRTWSISLGKKWGRDRLSVTRTHGLDGWWILSEVTGRRELKSATIDAAKVEALIIYRNALTELMDGVQ